MGGNGGRKCGNRKRKTHTRKKRNGFKMNLRRRTSHSLHSNRKHQNLLGPKGDPFDGASHALGIIIECVSKRCVVCGFLLVIVCCLWFVVCWLFCGLLLCFVIRLVLYVCCCTVYWFF